MGQKLLLQKEVQVMIPKSIKQRKITNVFICLAEFFIFFNTGAQLIFEFQ